ncbi:hypothetical protein JAAARDRAFT_74772 [Jaapia argillacea MUCL 33604]|uniref:Uncharacterized protein n=1 Tax=Jaapia argillacea MUCL 33604 TaxID=933084 RepID=A0A067P347_9AGAM|nr:hypothetical protein JAAARDRAFT_74772 [Jaapia argillacea MUCL 33604]
MLRSAIISGPAPTQGSISSPLPLSKNLPSSWSFLNEDPYRKSQPVHYHNPFSRPKLHRDYEDRQEHHECAQPCRLPRPQHTPSRPTIKRGITLAWKRLTTVARRSPRVSFVPPGFILVTLPRTTSEDGDSLQQK